MTGLRSTVESCLDKHGDLSVREDVLGVYGDDHPRDRSVRDRLEQLQNDPFVRVAVVTVRPPGSNAGQYAHLQRDLDDANTVYRNECGAWVYPAGSRVVQTNVLGGSRLLNQDDCRWGYHSVSREEDALFDLGRDMGADVVCYCIGGSTVGGEGCAAHPDRRPGFWIDPTPGRWTFAHELTHVVGDNLHTGSDTNLMEGGKGVTNPPPDLTSRQCTRILNDTHTETC